jgi:hypothetical protein
MQLPKEYKDVVEIILYNNLANLIAPQPTLVIPAGFEHFVSAVVIEYFGYWGLPSDLTDVIKGAIGNEINLKVIITEP